MRLKRPGKATLRAFAIGITAVLCTLAILSAVFPFPEGQWEFLSISTSRAVSAQGAVSTNGMAYAQVNKSGCMVYKGNVQIRLDFYLEPEDVRYKDCVINGTLVPFHTHFIYLPATFTQADIEAAVDANLGNFYKAFEDGWDKTQGGMRHGWATSQRIKPTDYSKVLNVGQYSKQVSDCQKSVDALTEFSYKPDGDIKGQIFPSTDIDVGQGVSSYNGYIFSGGSPSTVLCKNNPANDTGTIDTVQVTIKINTGTNYIRFGTFYQDTGYYYYCRDAQNCGQVIGTGTKQYTGLDIDIETNDLIGADGDSSGGSLAIGMGSSSGATNQLSGLAYCYVGSYGEYYVGTGFWYGVYGTGDTGGGVPSISNTPDNYGFGVLEVGVSVTTGLGYFTITNNGTVPVDITIQGTNATGGDDTWVLSDTATPGENTYGLRASASTETLYEYYDTGGDNSVASYLNVVNAQTFTPSTNHTITSVSLLLFRDAPTAGNITVDIKNVDGNGHPTGAALATSTFNGDDLTTDPSGEWRNIVLSTTTTITEDVKYAVVLTGGDVAWVDDSTSSTYSGGSLEQSTDYGVTWTTFSSIDFLFKEYGASFDVIVKQTPVYNTLVSNLAVDATQAWGLELLMPTSLSGYDAQQMTATITLVASEAT